LTHNERAARKPRRDRAHLVQVLEEAGVPMRDYPELQEPLLTTSQVALILRTSPRTVRNWADDGKIGTIRSLGGRRLFPASSILEALESMVTQDRSTDAERQ
jgi:excisionase family DNA binding protein